ncbi:MAG: hypothetical protein WA742_03845 [Candidatus Cybelea sp.]
MADFEAIAQRVFEENGVERWVVLLEVLGAFNILTTMRPDDPRDFVNEGSAWSSEGNAGSCRARVGIGKNIEEIRPDITVSSSIAVTHDAWRRWLGAEESHEGVVERAHGICIVTRRSM